jgi:hypothetical protein
VLGQPLGAGPRAEADCRFEQRALDEAPGAGSLALVQRGEDALHRPHAGAQIADRQADRGRRPVRLAGDMHDAAHALRDQVKAAAAGMGTVIAEPGELGVDQPWKLLVQRLEAQPDAGHHGRTIVLDQHVHIGDELEKQCPSFPLLVVKSNALLIAVDVTEVSVALAAVAPSAGRIPLPRPFQLDDLRAHIGEDHRAERPRHVLGQVQHFEAVEWAIVVFLVSHESVLRSWLIVVPPLSRGDDHLSSEGRR